MREFTISDGLWLPRPRDEVFAFFSAARNLEKITPPWLKFTVVTPEPIVMRKGLFIDYRIKVHGIPIPWRTEITTWEPPERFVDEQLWGPYVFWHHTHTFLEREGGTLCRDDVRYHPYGGTLINRLFVRRDVETIFDIGGRSCSRCSGLKKPARSRKNKNGARSKPCATLAKLVLAVS